MAWPRAATRARSSSWLMRTRAGGPASAGRNERLHAPIDSDAGGGAHRFRAGRIPADANAIEHAVRPIRLADVGAEATRGELLAQGLRVRPCPVRRHLHREGLGP